jgi:hypothetical protein
MNVGRGITTQMEALLIENGIDVGRCTAAKVEHEAGGPTRITVTLLAIKQDKAEPGKVYEKPRLKL